MSRRLLIFLIILVVAVPPIGAWFLVSNSYSNEIQNKNPDPHVTTATKDELFEAIKNGHKEGHFYKNNSSEQAVAAVTSFTVFDHWWYIVFVTIKDSSSVPVPMIVSKFYDGPNTINIVTNPGEPLPLYSISDMLGVPYGVIEEYNKALSALGD